jgi:uncharacterized membrane protein (DUF106 family)
MKNSNPVQLVLLIIAMLLGYNAMQTIPFFIWLIYRWFVDGLTVADTFQNLAINFLFIGFYFISAVLLVKRSKYLAEKISETASLSLNINIAVNKKDILYVTLVAMGGYILMTRLPKLLVKTYLFIVEKNDPSAYDGPNYILPGDSVSEFIIMIILAIILITYAKPITKYLIGSFEENTDINEIGSKPEEK